VPPQVEGRASILLTSILIIIVLMRRLANRPASHFVATIYL
jgi:hypothetical protein